MSRAYQYTVRSRGLCCGQRVARFARLSLRQSPSTRCTSSSVVAEDLRPRSSTVGEIVQVGGGGELASGAATTCPFARLGTEPSRFADRGPRQLAGLGRPGQHLLARAARLADPAPDGPADQPQEFGGA